MHVLIETHGALRDAYAIAALPQVECLSFGIMDFVSAHYGAIPGSAMRTPGQFTHPLVVRAKLEMVAACHAHGKVPSHNVTTEIKDSAVVANDAQRAAAEFGFTRMWSIHPDQIKPIIKAFTPRLSEVNEATNILTEAHGRQLGADRPAWPLARPRQLPLLLDGFAARQTGRPDACRTPQLAHRQPTH